MSYPAYRIKKIEHRLPHINNSKERKRAHTELSILKKVVQADHDFCKECVFDCLQCQSLQSSMKQSIFTE